ncbi:CHASE1-domain containing sensor protein [Bradyrhizobium sp. CIR18]|nr:CHASE1-domain containing sensor protein [Bradyrhizobium sp. CIR18]
MMRASAPPASPPTSARNFNIVAIALTGALVTLQLVGLAVLERSHAHAMQMSFPREAAACTERPDAVVPQIPYD